MFVIVHGPQACGKTQNSAKFAVAFGCKKIVDDWDGQSPVPAGALALTSVEPPFATKGKVVSFGDACRLAGVRSA